MTRTISLVEHEPQLLALSATEAHELRTLSGAVLRVAPEHDGWRLTPSSRVGTVVLPSVRLLIRPKAGVRNTLYLLASARRIDWSVELFPYDTDDLVLAIAWWFDREVEHASRFGLVRDYVDRRDLLTTIRGRVAFERQLAARPGLRIPIECAFQDYSEDTPLNRLLKTAHAALLRVPGLERGVAMRLRHRARGMLGEVGSVDHAPGVPPELPSVGMRREWGTAARLAHLIVRDLAIRDAPGETPAQAFVVDMNQLFQQFVTDIARERALAASCTLEAARERELTVSSTRADGDVLPAVTIKPDLVLVRDGVPVAVADVKYKAPGAGAGWQAPDAYQLISYCVRLGLGRGLLVLCGPCALGSVPVVDTPLALATIGVDVTGAPLEILAQARAAADALVAQARGGPGVRAAGLSPRPPRGSR